MLAVAIDENNIQKKILIETLAINDIVLARKHFEDYKSKGMVEGDFDADSWFIDNEVARRRISFDINANRYKKTVEPITGIGCHEYILYSKAFLVFMIGKFNPEYIRNISAFIIAVADIVEKAAVKDYGFIKDTNGLVIEKVIEFLEVLPGNREKIEKTTKPILEYIDISISKTSERRVLREFITYYRFDTVFSEFWKEASVEEKLKYFPIYFWWKVTTIVPTRVTEFAVTPRDCLKIKAGVPYVVLRKTRGKKKNGEYAYNLEGDYDKCEFPIPQEIADEITWYISSSQSLIKPDNGTLFYRFETKGKEIWKHFSSRGLFVLLKDFYEDVLQDRFNMIIVDDDDIDSRIDNAKKHGGFTEHIIADNEIGVVRGGDTRHIAMINAVFATHSLYICKTLAGHESAYTAAWYAGNIEMLVESAVFEELHKAKQEGLSEQDMVMNLYKAAGFGEKVVPVSKTIGCASQKFAAGDYDDCSEVAGDCIKCAYKRSLRASGTDNYNSTFNAKAKFQADLDHLKYELEQYRRGCGCDETIDEALSRIQHSAAKYRETFINKLLDDKKELI